VNYRVSLAREAKVQLDAIYDYIAAEASPEIARRYTDAIIDKCHSLSRFPNRGSRRDDLRPGVRTLVFRRRVIIAYLVEPGEVTILGIFSAGQDFEALLREE
jgi:toxin ParE1/3/4